MRAVVFIALLGGLGACSVIDAISGDDDDEDDDDIAFDAGVGADAGPCTSRVCYGEASFASVPDGDGSQLALGSFGSVNRDLVVATWQGGLYVFEHDDAGTFTEVTPPVFFDVPVERGVGVMTAGQFDGTGDEELVTAVWEKAVPNTTYLSARYFNRHDDFDAEGRSAIVDAFDLIQNGADELVLLTENPHALRVFRYQAGVGWVMDHELFVPEEPLDVAAADFNDDTCIDLAFLTREGTSPPQVGVLIANPPCDDTPAEFSDPMYFEVDVGARRIAATNFTIGPTIAIAFACVGASCDAPWTFLEVRQWGTGTLVAPRVERQGGGFEPGDMLADDIDGDEQPDLAILNQPNAADGSDVIVLYGDSAGFVDMHEVALAGTGDNFVAGHFNLDERLDFATVSYAGDIIVTLSE